MPGQAPALADERSLLLAYIEQQRDAVRLAAYGLTDEQARLAPTPSQLTVGGLVKHIAAMERGWMATIAQRPQPVAEAEKAYLDDFVLGPDETLADALAAVDATARETETLILGIADLGQAVPVPKDVPWFPADVEAWTVRWVLLHLIEELARHAGHADIVREAIDGATALSLMAAAEGWPASPWVQAWQPAVPTTVRAEPAKTERGSSVIDTLRGSATVQMSTEEVMKLTRGS